MYVIIVGAGEVGSYLARILVAEGHDVAVVESDESIASQLEGSLDALVVQGSGVSLSVLERAGIKRADLFIAVTEVDEVNLISCMTAGKFGNAPRTIARVREAEYLLGESSLSAEELGLSLLASPEHAVATQIASLLSFEGTGEIRYLAKKQLVLLELPLTPDSPLVHESLAELGETFPSPSLVAAVRRDDGLRIPRGDDKLAPDERVEIITVPDAIDEFLILSGQPWHQVRHVLIVGCGTIGFHLAEALTAQRLHPTIVEIDPKRAQRVAKAFPKSMVLVADGTDPQFLREQLEESADAVAVLLSDDDKALLTGMLAKHLGAKKVVVRAEHLEYAPIAHRMGVDALLSPRRALANTILRFVRGGHVERAMMLGDNEGEVIELEVPAAPKNERIVSTPLRDLDMPEGSLVGAVVRGGEVTIAGGDTVLEPGDLVLVVALSSAIAKVEELLR